MMVKKVIRTEVNKIIDPSFGKAVLSNDNRSNFSFSEKGKSYTAENISRKIGLRLQIEDKMYDSSTKKCDKGLLLEDGRFFLIELKGDDTNEACKQLITTIGLLKNDYQDYDFDYYGRIVAKRGTPQANSNRQRAEKIFGRTKFLLRETLLTEKI